MNISTARGGIARTRMAAALSLAFAGAVAMTEATQASSYASGISNDDARLDSARRHYALRMAQRAERVHERSPWRERPRSPRHISSVRSSFSRWWTTRFLRTASSDCAVASPACGRGRAQRG